MRRRGDVRVQAARGRDLLCRHRLLVQLLQLRHDAEHLRTCQPTSQSASKEGYGTAVMQARVSLTLVSDGRSTIKALSHAAEAPAPHPGTIVADSSAGVVDKRQHAQLLHARQMHQLRHIADLQAAGPASVHSSAPWHCKDGHRRVVAAPLLGIAPGFSVGTAAAVSGIHGRLCAKPLWRQR